jgi:DNA replication and repair protein RecF
VRIKKLIVQNFRCFETFTLNCDAPYVIISGANGSGKSSLLEALHYACYLRSFRTHLPRDLIYSGKKAFALDVVLEDNDTCHMVHVGVSQEKKRIKINQKVVQTYRELVDHYRVVTITEDDLLFIKGGPEVRRSFMDQSIALFDANYIQQLRSIKKILAQRNALLAHGRIDVELYQLWTTQLWDHSVPIWEKRNSFIAILQKRVNALIHEHIDPHLIIQVGYSPKQMDALSVDELIRNDRLYMQEQALGRSLFGVHLDDITCTLHGKLSRSYASRGQQKLIVLMIKIAFLEELAERKGSAVLLLDDFMTDFDEKKIELLLLLLAKHTYQVIVTTPIQFTPSMQSLMARGGVSIHLTG